MFTNKLLNNFREGFIAFANLLKRLFPTPVKLRPPPLRNDPRQRYQATAYQTPAARTSDVLAGGPALSGPPPPTQNTQRQKT